MISSSTTTAAAPTTSSTTQIAAPLPDPFVFGDGHHRVRTPSEWPARRAELLELIQQDEYGHLPPAPKNMQVVPLLLHRPSGQKAMHRQFKLICDPGHGHEKISFVVDVLVPQSDSPVPIILTGDWGWHKTPPDITQTILSRGYGIAEFNRCELAPDLGSGKSDQTAALYASYPGGDFGAIVAWAWGFHRCVDFLVTQPYVAKDKIAVTGHSRGGKAALLAGATDERVALTAPNCSGCGGAGCFRVQGPNSETLQNIVTNFPGWFSPRLREFIGGEDQLPFDQHEVKALCAPRALLSTEALDDLHANPSGSYQTYLAAREVYRFLGRPERIAIRFRPGVHEQNADDFATLLDFADQIFFNEHSTRDWNASPFGAMPRAFTWRAPEMLMP